jgi:hypothetical protein
MALGFGPLGSYPLGALPSDVGGSEFTVVCASTAAFVGATVVESAFSVSCAANLLYEGVILAPSRFSATGNAAFQAAGQVLVSAKFSAVATSQFAAVGEIPPELAWLGPRVKLRSPVIRAISTSRDERGVIKVVE